MSPGVLTAEEAEILRREAQRPGAISISDIEILHDARLGERPHRQGMRIILEGTNIDNKMQIAECLNIGDIEYDSNLGPDLLERAERCRAHQRVADSTYPKDKHLRPAVGASHAQRPARP